MSDRIVITRPLPGDARVMLADAGFENTWCYDVDDNLPRETLLEQIQGAAGLLCLPGDRNVNAEVFDAAGESLKVISQYAVGYDNIDVEEAKKRGIAVGHTPDPVTEPTTDMTWLLLLGAARRVTEGAALVRNGAWTGVGPNILLGHRVRGKTLLIIGPGRIGLAVARRSVPWDMKLLYHGRTWHLVFETVPLFGRRVDLDEGLREADFVSIHTPLTDQTHHLIGARELDLMKRSAVLINTARGPIIDETALVDALREKKIAAAGLDVFENEPALHPGLAELDNAFILPHLGSATLEDRQWMTRTAVENLVAGLRGETMPFPVV